MSSSGVLSTGGMLECWSKSRGGQQVDQRAGAPLLRGKTENLYFSAWSIEGSRKTLLQERLDSLFSRVCCDRTRSDGFKLKGQFR